MLFKAVTRVLIIFCLLATASGIASAGEDVNKQTFFNNVTDSIATIGKSEKEKKNIIRKRKIERKNARLADNREKYNKRLKKKNKKQNKSLLKDVERQRSFRQKGRKK